MNHDSHTQHDEVPRLAEAIKNASSLIANCPAELLQDVFTRHYSISFVPDTQGLNIQSNLLELECMAALGNEDAVRVMVEVGLRISKFLDLSCSLESPNDALDAPSRPSPCPEDYTTLTSTGFELRLEQSYKEMFAAAAEILEKVDTAIGTRYKSNPYELDHALGMFHSAISDILKASSATRTSNSSSASSASGKRLSSARRPFDVETMGPT